MVVTLTFTPQQGGTVYIARAKHWTVEDKTTHEQMGFHQVGASRPTSSRRWRRRCDRMRRRLL